MLSVKCQKHISIGELAHSDVIVLALHGSCIKFPDIADCHVGDTGQFGEEIKNPGAA
jgi:hypothetical protein